MASSVNNKADLNRIFKYIEDEDINNLVVEVNKEGIFDIINEGIIKEGKKTYPLEFATNKLTYAITDNSADLNKIKKIIDIIFLLLNRGADYLIFMHTIFSSIPYYQNMKKTINMLDPKKENKYYTFLLKNYPISVRRHITSINSRLYELNETLDYDILRKHFDGKEELIKDFSKEIVNLINNNEELLKSTFKEIWGKYTNHLIDPEIYTFLNDLYKEKTGKSFEQEGGRKKLKYKAKKTRKYKQKNRKTRKA